MGFGKRKWERGYTSRMGINTEWQIFAALPLSAHSPEEGRDSLVGSDWKCSFVDRIWALGAGLVSFPKLKEMKAEYLATSQRKRGLGRAQLWTLCFSFFLLHSYEHGAFAFIISAHIFFNFCSWFTALDVMLLEREVRSYGRAGRVWAPWWDL